MQQDKPPGQWQRSWKCGWKLKAVGLPRRHSFEVASTGYMAVVCTPWLPVVCQRHTTAATYSQTLHMQCSIISLLQRATGQKPEPSMLIVRTPVIVAVVLPPFPLLTCTASSPTTFSFIQLPTAGSPPRGTLPASITTGTALPRGGSSGTTSTPAVGTSGSVRRRGLLTFSSASRQIEGSMARLQQQQPNSTRRCGQQERHDHQSQQ